MPLRALLSGFHFVFCLSKIPACLFCRTTKSINRLAHADSLQMVIPGRIVSPYKPTLTFGRWVFIERRSNFVLEAGATAYQVLAAPRSQIVVVPRGEVRARGLQQIR